MQSFLCSRGEDEDGVSLLKPLGSGPFVLVKRIALRFDLRPFDLDFVVSVGDAPSLVQIAFVRRFVSVCEPHSIAHGSAYEAGNDIYILCDPMRVIPDIA
jgi:hypothetical protein